MALSPGIDIKAILKSALAGSSLDFPAEGSEQPTFCDKDDFQGRSFSTSRHVGNFAPVGFRNSASSVFVVGSDRYAPAPLVVKYFRRRKNDRPYQADMSAVRAVVGPAEQRCWTELEPVSDGSGDARVPAVIGGILGHQMGGGTGQKMTRPPGATVSVKKKASPVRNSRAACSRLPADL